MASFAKIGLNNKVIAVVELNDDVIKDSAGVEREDLGVDALAQISGWAIWKRTFPDGSQRGRFAGKGYIYDEDNDLFFPPKPFPSWVKNIEDAMWKAPVDEPDDGEYYVWDEPSGSWKNAERPENNYTQPE